MLLTSRKGGNIVVFVRDRQYITEGPECLWKSKKKTYRVNTGVVEFPLFPSSKHLAIHIQNAAFGKIGICT